MDILNVIFGVIGTVGALLGFQQWWEARRKTREERERLALQLQRNKVAVRSVVDSAFIVDRIVQRSKDPSVTDAELRTLARLARGSLITLAMELDNEADVLGAWSRGARFIDSKAPDRTSGLPDDDEDAAVEPPPRPQRNEALSPAHSGE